MLIFKEKRTMPRISISLLMLLLILPTSCKKDDPMEPCNACNHDTSFETMSEWCYFDVGSWWVYEEIVTGDIDSVYVYQSGIDYDAESFIFRTYSSWYDNDFSYWHNASYVGPSNISTCSLRRLFRNQASNGNFVGGGIIANFPMIQGDFSGGGGTGVGDGVHTTSVYSSFIFEGVDYGPTAEFTIGVSGSEGDDSLMVRISKNFGIIYKELPEQNRYWKLVNYNIVQ